MTELLARHTAFTGRVFDVVVEQFRTLDGHTRTMDVIRHRSSVVMLVMPAPDRLVLISQYRHPVGRRLWEVPAGTLEPGEDALDGARRECEEETGYAPGTLVPLGRFFAVPGYCDEEMLFYVATDLTRPVQPAAPDEDEDIEPREVQLEVARAMIGRGEIADMKSALAIALLADRGR